MIPAHKNQVNEQLNQLTALLKALDGQANLTKEKEALSVLTTEATALLASKPNHPSGEALQALLEKNKELLASSELTPEALETAKTGLETFDWAPERRQASGLCRPCDWSRSSILQLRANRCQRTKSRKS